MATDQHSLARSWTVETLYDDSAMTLIIDGTCDSTLSISHNTSTEEDSYVSSASDTQCVPQCTMLNREVEGCEEPTTYKSDYSNNSCVFSPIVSCSKDSRSSRHSKISSSYKSSSHPLASSTMIEDLLVENGSSDICRRKRKDPCASSTMIEEAEVPVINVTKPRNDQCFSEAKSVYTWTIQDNTQETMFDGSYVLRHHKLVEPSTAYIKLLKTSNRNNGYPKTSSKRILNRLHEVPSNVNVFPSVDKLSVNDRYLDTESLYDEDIPVKSHSLPRTSTKINLYEDTETLYYEDTHIKSNSLPRTSTKKNLNTDSEDFHTVPCSSDESSDLKQERLEPELPPRKVIKRMKFTRTQLKKLFSFKWSKGKNSKKSASSQHASVSSLPDKLSTDDKTSHNIVQMRSKKTLVQKTKRHSANL